MKKKIKYSQLFEFLKEEYKQRKRLRERKRELARNLINKYKLMIQYQPKDIYNTILERLVYLSDRRNVKSFRTNRKRKK